MYYHKYMPVNGWRRILKSVCKKHLNCTHYLLNVYRVQTIVNYHELTWLSMLIPHVSSTP